MSLISPKKGRLLIAEPSILNDNSFNRSIILLTEHTKNNSIGFIINKPLSFTVQDLVPETDCSFPVYQGGPVEQDNLYFVHKVPNLIHDSIEVANGIFWGGNFDSLKELLNSQKLKISDIRFFLGYSGWEHNQLEDELKTDSWFISENNYSNIFATDNTTIWKNKLLEKGGKYKIWANAPGDIQLN
ncbi:MAG: YqgE/AlgH family protein [Polaribacter sp.]|jgi:putative transcriptional regulator|nr:YqgE/AlgH family protein [Polaribacter sp.]MDG1954763.1 YqgE/AlgH family protein [Polaribacter sp.]